MRTVSTAFPPTLQLQPLGHAELMFRYQNSAKFKDQFSVNRGSRINCQLSYLAQCRAEAMETDVFRACKEA
jgi:hypothetical protein